MCLVIDSHKLIFIHIPKNAGSSIREALKSFEGYDCGLHEHATARQVRDAMGTRKYNDYFKFCVVRNPWAWIASMYFYLKARKSDTVDNVDFPTYVRKRCTYNLDLQVDYISYQNHIIVDKILHFESINEDFINVMKQMGITATLPRINCSPTSDYSQLYDEELSKMVAQSHTKDLEMFKYTFDEGLNSNIAAQYGNKKWIKLR